MSARNQSRAALVRSSRRLRAAQQAVARAAADSDAPAARQAPQAGHVETRPLPRACRTPRECTPPRANARVPRPAPAPPVPAPEWLRRVLCCCSSNKHASTSSGEPLEPVVKRPSPRGSRLRPPLIVTFFWAAPCGSTRKPGVPSSGGLQDAAFQNLAVSKCSRERGASDDLTLVAPLWANGFIIDFLRRFI